MRRSGTLATLAIVLGLAVSVLSPASALASTTAALTGISATGVSAAAGQRAAPDVLGCKQAPTPELPGRGVVGFFASAPKTLPPPGDPFAAGSTTSIYQQYGYAGLRWNTFDLGCGPDVARSPDAAIGTAVANWIVTLPKAAVAATGALLGAAFAPDFLVGFDPLIGRVVDTLRRTVFEQWAFVVVGALGLLLIWRARRASLASSAGAVGWALLVMVLVTMVFRWPLVAGHAADVTVTSTLGAVASGLNGKTAGASADAGTEATAGMHQALLYQAWLGGTFGDTNSDVARRYGPVIFDATALTWREAQILQSDPTAGQKIIDAKEKRFVDAAAQIKTQDPDAYAYLTGERSDTRVGYALLAGLATLCAVPFLFAAGLLVLGALMIVRFGVMLFPAFATLGLFPTMRTLVTGIGSTVAAALINAVVFGIGAAVTVLGMGVLLSPATGTPPWLDIILMLLLTIVMWVALKPFRRLTQMVSGRTNHFASAAGGVSTVTRGAGRVSGRILGTALGSFLGASAGHRAGERPEARTPQTPATQRAEAHSTYLPAPDGPDDVPPQPAESQPAESRPAESRPAESRPAGRRTGPPRPAPARPRPVQAAGPALEAAPPASPTFAPLVTPAPRSASARAATDPPVEADDEIYRPPIRQPSGGSGSRAEPQPDGARRLEPVWQAPARPARPAPARQG